MLTGREGKRRIPQNNNNKKMSPKFKRNKISHRQTETVECGRSHTCMLCARSTYNRPHAGLCIMQDPPVWSLIKAARVSLCASGATLIPPSTPKKKNKNPTDRPPYSADIDREKLSASSPYIQTLILMAFFFLKNKPEIPILFPRVEMSIWLGSDRYGPKRKMNMKSVILLVKWLAIIYEGIKKC